MSEDYLSSEELLGFPDLKEESVAMPEWGNKKVRVRGATAYEMGEYEESLTQTKIVDGRTETVGNFTNAKARLLVKCIIDQDGKRMYTDTQAPALGKKSSVAINRLFDVVNRLSGRTRQADKVTEGNSETGPSDASPSLSPGT